MLFGTTGVGIADEGSLRGSSEVVAKRIRDEIKHVLKMQVLAARSVSLTLLTLEIAAVMLQRQQASAIID